MRKIKNSKATANNKPRVVYDPKMPEYRFVNGGDYSLSVDRNRNSVNKPLENCLANITLK